MYELVVPCYNITRLIGPTYFHFIRRHAVSLHIFEPPRPETDSSSTTAKSEALHRLF